jgi:hypothetical protein
MFPPIDRFEVFMLLMLAWHEFGMARQRAGGKRPPDSRWVRCLVLLVPIVLALAAATPLGDLLPRWLGSPWFWAGFALIEICRAAHERQLTGAWPWTRGQIGQPPSASR